MFYWSRQFELTSPRSQSSATKGEEDLWIWRYIHNIMYILIKHLCEYNYEAVSFHRRRIYN